MTSLGTIPAFRALPPESLAAISRVSRAVRYGAGAVVRPQGTPASGVLLLLSGTVTAEHATPDGARVWPERWTGPSIVDKPAVLGGAAAFDGTAAIDGTARPSALIAVTSCAGRLLPADRFLRLLDEEQSVRGHVLAHLAHTVLAGRRRLAHAVALPAVAQVAAWLAAQDAADRVVWRGTQEHLGRVLGLSRVTVNRALGRLARQGAIELTPQGIVIIDGSSLRLHCGL